MFRQEKDRDYLGINLKIIVNVLLTKHAMHVNMKLQIKHIILQV